ncbi:MAG: diheme cytochrome c, partial [Gammaproteobacteria bacterium]|nr:diheme cytochrome c [Gammaproteobacteria bacterium]
MKLKTIPLTALAVCTLGANSVLADDDWGWSRRAPDVAPVKNELYQSECGSCHFAYQPGLLPA